MSAYYAWYYDEHVESALCVTLDADGDMFSYSWHFGLEDALSAIYSSYAVSAHNMLAAKTKIPQAFIQQHMNDHTEVFFIIMNTPINVILVEQPR